jgi:MinD-like ATPase involved in chromosome partitioning or flagellar assembly
VSGRTLALALVGGDRALAAELEAVAVELGDVLLLAPSAADRADAVLVADSRGASLADEIRELTRLRPWQPVLCIDGGDGVDPGRAMAAGARGLMTRPLTRDALRDGLLAAGAFDAPSPGASMTGTEIVVLLGAVGGAGTTTAAVALARALGDAVVVDLDLSAGDAVAVADASRGHDDLLLRLAAPGALQTERLASQLARSDDLLVLPAPALPEQADLVDEDGARRALVALAGIAPRLVIDAGSRIGPETVPALERARSIVLVTTADQRGARGLARTVGLLGRLALGGRRLGVFMRHGAGDAAAAAVLAGDAGLPLLAVVREDRSIAASGRRGASPPRAPYAPLAEAVRRVLVA